MTDDKLEKLRKQANNGSAIKARMMCDLASDTLNREMALEVRGLAAQWAHKKSFDAKEWVNVYWDACKVAAQLGDFDSYMLYLEKNRAPQERFYKPRRQQLHDAVCMIQALLDDELDEAFLSMPPRVGKTTLLMFLITFIVGLKPDASNLYSAFSDTITNAMYSGVCEVLKDPYTYLWAEIFPGKQLAYTNAKEETLDIERMKRYHSFTSRSLYGTLNGACDCSGFEIADDLIGGIEEALSPDRLASCWSKVDNNYIPRAKMGAKRLWVGTRWATKDPAGIRMAMLQDDEAFKSVRWKAINMSALNDKDESNFNYEYGVGFDTDYYKQRRASFESTGDMASWLAQYQGDPVDRVGTLFHVDDFEYYNGMLPDDEPDGILMACDVAWGGGDFLCSMVGVLYDDTVYIPDIVFDKSDKHVTRPKVVSQIISNGVRRAQFEKNNGGDEYREWVSEHLGDYSLSITSKSAPNTKRKAERILERAPEIRKFVFLENAKRNSDYNMFMSNLLSYKIEGKNKNDDAADCCAQLATMISKGGKAKVKTFRRCI